MWPVGTWRACSEAWTKQEGMGLGEGGEVGKVFGNNKREREEARKKWIRKSPGGVME